ncbi:MAG: hypothetical protein II968_07200 [Selenomonadaceae bacterium]|nr:hypothetical protein [Selenomonadaceae bacterium]MBQ6757818.1 hypothetical protein [Selenomonadaceae bacterium]
MIEFSYRGDISHLDAEEREQLNSGLEAVIHKRDLYYLYVDRKEMCVGGSYNGDYFTDYHDVEDVLRDFQIDFTGGAEFADAY